MIRLLICLTLVSSPYALSAQDEKPAANSDQKLVAVRVAILESSGDLQLKDGANLSAANLNELIADLRGQNALEHYQFFNLATLENQQAVIQVGREEAVISGRTFAASRGGGGTPRVLSSYQSRQTGSHVQVVSRVRGDGQIIVELSVECSRLVSSKKEELKTDSDAGPADVTPLITKTLTAQTTVLLAPGVSTVIAAGGNDHADGSSREYIIVTATVK